MIGGFDTFVQQGGFERWDGMGNDEGQRPGRGRGAAGQKESAGRIGDGKRTR